MLRSNAATLIPSRPYHTLDLSATSSGGADFIRHQTIARRGATTRRVKLTTEGNWINEYAPIPHLYAVTDTRYPVPRPISFAVEPKWINLNLREFIHMRYTAATCDPDDFTPEHGWHLRANQYGRETERLIAVTSYNEDKILFCEDTA